MATPVTKSNTKIFESDLKMFYFRVSKGRFSQYGDLALLCICGPIDLDAAKVVINLAYFSRAEDR
jgi:hypothetical protein